MTHSRERDAPYGLQLDTKRDGIGAEACPTNIVRSAVVVNRRGRAKLANDLQTTRATDDGDALDADGVEAEANESFKSAASEFDHDSKMKYIKVSRFRVG